MKKNTCQKSPLQILVRPGKSLYLARSILGSRLHYYLRQSFYDENDCLRHREIADLGEDPSKYIVTIEDNGYYISEGLVEAIEPCVEGDADSLLEELLWPFVAPEIRSKLQYFNNRGKVKPITKVSRQEKEAIDREIHIFDRRRMHYLWYGAIDQSGLYKMPDKLCRKLLGKSRDEKEQYFVRKERVFYEDQIKEYLYTIFNLQQYFAELYTRLMPQALGQEKLDTFFVEELCLLAQDDVFWMGMEKTEVLSPYLIRYLIMFFDYEFAEQSYIDDYIRQFMNSHRKFSWPQRKKQVTLEQASAIFGLPAEKLAELSKKELTKLYRQKAKELHPDTPGGEHDEFVKLTQAYEELLFKKN
ncbi:MAG: J domain-containing protein [Desulfobulbaceae bacterium]|nr:J domain-containing protein [Desulfobulbaceae bacterium]